MRRSSRKVEESIKEYLTQSRKAAKKKKRKGSKTILPSRTTQRTSSNSLRDFLRLCGFA